MPGVDKAAVLSLLAPAIVHCLPTTTESDSTRETAEGDAVASRLDSHAIAVQFDVPCAGCQRDPWPIELTTESINGVCEDVAVSINDRNIDHRWYSRTARSSGAIPAMSQSSSVHNEVWASWQSKCMTTPLESHLEKDLYVLAVFLGNGTSGLQEDLGFTISYAVSGDMLKIDRLSLFPLNFSDEHGWDTWALSANAEGKDEIQSPGHDVEETQSMLKPKGHKTWGTVSIAHPLQHQKRENTILGVDIPTDYPTKRFIRNCAIAFLILLVIALALRTIRRSTAFRRRRRDIASRREERRARRAYRNAARRLRWRQWWQGRTATSDTRSTRSNHSLVDLPHLAVDHPQHSTGEFSRHDNGDGSDRDNDDYDSSYLEEDDAEEAGGGLMQAEILGLRRVLEYVGELVGNESTSALARRTARSRSRSRPPPRYDELYHSPRASTMFSLDTGSLTTLDTTDSETAPPSYHP